jgi:hypothetical protein
MVEPPETLSAEQLAAIWALTFEAHGRVGKQVQCGCVSCRIRHIMSGGFIIPQPEIER